MTPASIRDVAKRRWPIAAAVVLVLTVAGVVNRVQRERIYRADAPARDVDRPPVKTYRITPRDITGTLKRIGTIRAKAETELRFGATGRIARFPVEKGQFVRRGALVASLDPSEAESALELARLEFEKSAVKYFTDRTIDRLTYEQAKTRFRLAQLEAGKATLHAAHDGYLVEKWVDAGAQVDPTTTIGRLVDKSRVFVEMDLPEDDIQFLREGQSVSVSIDAVPDFSSNGTVRSVTPYLRGHSRSFSVKVDLSENPGEKLHPGMFARCGIRRYEKRGALTVPLEVAAEIRDKSLRLFVIDDRNIARERTVDVLFMDGGVAEIAGVREGESVVMHPGAEMEDGAVVSVTDVFDPTAHGEHSVTAE